MKNEKEEVFTFINAWGHYRDLISKKIEWGVIFWPRQNNFKNSFFAYLSAYMENTRSGKKRRKTEHISVNNKWTNMKKFLDPFFLY